MGSDATLGMLQGIKIATDIVRETYGGSGSNVIVESHLNPGHMIANDAQTIIQAIKLTDPAQKRGLAFLQELCNRADKMSGDARKTTILLCEAIIKLGYDSGVNKLQLKRELDELTPIIENEIDQQTIKISVEEVSKVAATASESVETGALLQDIYTRIGKDGIIQPEGSGTYETSCKFIEGVRFDMSGYLSPAFANQDGKAIYKHPLILITKKKITTDDDINPLLSEFMTMNDRRPLIIFTQDMDSGIASMLVDLHKSKRLEICIIKAPTLWQNYVFEDFAKCTGATIIEDATGLTLKKIPLSALGTCDKITVDQDETIIVGTTDITDHIASLKAKGDDESKLRLTWLTNKTALLKIGANSETDLSYKRLKLYDGIRSSESALRYGVVKGGGLCLESVSESLPDTIAGQLMAKALKVPRSQIVLNSDTLVVAGNVVDSAFVVKMAVRNAIGIASTVLTASSIIYLPDEPKKEPNSNPFQ